jgi:RNA polymerase sigma-70 factor (ECF subfamily)
MNFFRFSCDVSDGSERQGRLSMEKIEHLYHAHGPALLRYLQRNFGRCAAAEDLLQETFVQALRRQDRLSVADSPRAWLFGIARHVGLTALRRNRPTESLEVMSPKLAEPNPELATMREAISLLPPAMREPLELRLRENLSYEEIAAMLEIPIGTVRSRLHTAMQKLRDAMEK